VKRLIFGGLSVLLVAATTTPVWAQSKVESSLPDACQSIPAPQPTGGATLQRLEITQRCFEQLKAQQALTSNASSERQGSISENSNR